MSQRKPPSVDVQADVNCLVDKFRGHFRAYRYSGNDGILRTNGLSLRGEPLTAMVQFRRVAGLLAAIVGGPDRVPTFRESRQTHAIAFGSEVSVIKPEFDTRTDRVNSVVHDLVKANE